jgi:predicted RND superfamily exporter protein
MREQWIQKLAELAVDKTKAMVWIIVGLSIVLMMISGRMSMSPKWSDMLPKGDPRTVEFDRILEEFQSASSFVVVVQGAEEDIKAFADALAPRVMEPLSIPGSEEAPHVFVRRVDYKAETNFMREHGLMLMKKDELKNLKDLFQDPGLPALLTNINNSFEKEFIQPEEPMSNREEEDGALVFLNGINGWLTELEKTLEKGTISVPAAEAAVDQLLLGEPYFLSYDRQALIMNLIPTFSIMDGFLMVDGTNAVEAIIEEVLAEHPNVSAGLTGMLAVGRDEMIYSTQGLEVSSAISLFAIGALLFFAFKMWVAPLLALLNLVIGLIWAAGLVAIFVPVLNVMTAMFMIILIGLGIDFSIHVISTFTEMREKGMGLKDATMVGLSKSGKGVSTGAITTAIAFLTLMVGESRALSELGLVTAVGLLAVMISTFVALPTFLVIRERRKERKLNSKKAGVKKPVRDITIRPLGTAAQFFQDHPWLTLTATAIITIGLSMSAKEITFNHNMMDLEAEGLPSIMLQDTVQEKFDLSMDFAYLVAESVEESRVLKEKARDLPSVATVEDISIFLPTTEEQSERTPLIEEIQAVMASARARPITTNHVEQLLDEMARLEMNIMEFQALAFLGGQDKVFDRCTEIVGEIEGSSANTIFKRISLQLSGNRKKAVSALNKFQEAYADYFSASVLSMANTTPLELEMLPESIVDRYANKDRNLFLTTVLPSGNVWQDRLFMEQFATELETVSARTTGMPPVMNALFEIIGRDGRNAAILTIILVFIVLTLDFKHAGYALIAMLPLVAGASWMIGLMQLYGLQLDLMNVMALPLILGIGIDDGVHAVHRWRLEGHKSAFIVFSSTGKAILLTSLTTMLAFGSMMFSPFRGYASLSYALIFGVGACFLTTVIIIPACMGLLGKKGEGATQQ